MFSIKSQYIYDSNVGIQFIYINQNSYSLKYASTIAYPLIYHYFGKLHTVNPV